MTDTEKMYAYEMQRRQTIGNYLNRINNLGYGNAAGVPLNVKFDDSYGIDSEPKVDNLQTKAPAPKTPSDPEVEDPDLDINPSEGPEFEDPFGEIES